MNTKTAAQTFNSSVADGIELMMLPGHPSFKNGEATVDFTRIIDSLLDLLNVKNPYGTGFTQPLKLYNQVIVRPNIGNREKQQVKHEKYPKEMSK